MKKTVKTLLLLGSGLALLSFGVVVVNQTAQVVMLAREVHPVLGTVTLWGLLLSYTGLIAVPVVIIVRMPRAAHAARRPSPGPSSTPTSPSSAVAWRPIPGIAAARGSLQERRDIEEALRVLDLEAHAIVKQMATTVFLTTAVSQSGRLDAMLVLMAQSRMIWRIAHLYHQRPSLREMAHLYANVAATAFVAGELDDLELHQMIQPVVTASLGTMGGAIPGFQVFTTIAVNSLMSGSANAFLTLRVGMITKAYCGSLVARPRSMVRRSATAEAARMLSGIVKESGARVRDVLWEEVKKKIPRPWPMRKAQPETV